MEDVMEHLSQNVQIAAQHWEQMPVLDTNMIIHVDAILLPNVFQNLVISLLKPCVTLEINLVLLLLVVQKHHSLFIR